MKSLIFTSLLALPVVAGVPTSFIKLKPLTVTPTAVEINKLIQQKSAKYGIDAQLLTAVIRIESGFKNSAVNKRTGDRGLAQISPATAAAYGLQAYELHDPATNLKHAAKILKFWQRFEKSEGSRWVCRYNIGYKKLPATCDQYLKKLKLAGWKGTK